MTKQVPSGLWMVLVPGAFTYWRSKYGRDPSVTEVYNMLNDLGLLEGIDRKPDSIKGTIWNRIKKYRAVGLI